MNEAVETTWRDVAVEWRSGNINPLLDNISAMRSAAKGYRMMLEWVKSVGSEIQPLYDIPESMQHLRLSPRSMMTISTNLSAAFQIGYPDDGTIVYLLVEFPEYEWLRQLPIHTMHVGESSIYIQTLGVTPPGQAKAVLPTMLIEMRLDNRSMRLIRAFEKSAWRLGLAHVSLSSSEGIEVIEFDTLNTIPLAFCPRKEWAIV